MTSAYRIIKQRFSWNTPPKAHLKYELISFLSCFQGYHCNEKQWNDGILPDLLIHMSFLFMLPLIRSTLFIPTPLKQGLKFGQRSKVSGLLWRPSSTLQNIDKCIIGLELPNDVASQPQVTSSHPRMTQALCIVGWKGVDRLHTVVGRGGGGEALC